MKTLACVLLAAISMTSCNRRPALSEEERERIPSELNEMKVKLADSAATLEEALRNEKQRQEMQDSILKAMEANNSLAASYAEYRSKIHKSLAKLAGEYRAFDARADMVKGEAREIYRGCCDTIVKKADAVIAGTVNHGAFKDGEAQSYFEELAEISK